MSRCCADGLSSQPVDRLFWYDQAKQDFFMTWRKYIKIYRQEQAVRAFASQCGLLPENLCFVRPWQEDWPTFSNDESQIIAVHKRPDSLFSRIPAGYMCLLETPNLKLFTCNEKITRLFCIPDSDLNALLKSARLVIEGKTHDVENRRFPEGRFVVDVAIYLDGNVRASMVSQGENLKDVVVNAAKRCLTDTRFKPLSSAEISRCTVELVVTPDAWLELTESDVSSELVYPNFAYKVDHAGTMRGVYMPVVVALKGKLTMLQYLQSLGLQKSRLSLEEMKEAWFSMAPAQQVRESDRNFLDTKNIASDLNDKEFFAKSLLQNITKQVDKDGYVSVVRHPIEGHKYRFDMGRAAFVVHTCLECIERGFEVDTAKKLANAVSGYLLAIPKQNNQSADICQIYAYKDLVKVSEIVGNLIVISLKAGKDQQGEVLLLLQAIRTLQVGGVSNDDISKAISLVYEKWIYNKDKRSLAAYADLPVVLHAAGKTKESNEVVQWYQDLQNSNGSFPNTPGDQFVYTRGTSKIAESLSLLPGCEEVVDRALSWLRGMQYTENELHLVTPTEREYFLHGFKHDHWDQSLWVDADCHTLLALIRRGW